ncbi:uncharacterized protein TNCV_4059501 [Trichonephila clavipes]|nr:uncharacterized protein TNCV_4059501 [Trichonephila clavipes]
MELHKEMAQLLKECTGRDPQVENTRIVEHSNAFTGELRTSGTFYASRRGTIIGRYSRTPSLEQRILNTVDNNPLTSSRAVGRALGGSHQSVLRTLHEDRMHPYHLQRVQAITPDCYPRRLNFATYSRLQKIKPSLQMYYLLMKLPLRGREVFPELLWSMFLHLCAAECGFSTMELQLISPEMSGITCILSTASIGLDGVGQFPGHHVLLT